MLSRFKRFKPLLSLVVIALLLASFLGGCVTSTQPVEREDVRKTTAAKTTKTKTIDRNGSYTSKDDVALYIHTYGELPKNFISKKQAERLGCLFRRNAIAKANKSTILPGTSLRAC